MTERVSLVPDWIIGDLSLTTYPYSVDREDGVEVGEPEMEVEEVETAEEDGSTVRVVRHGNRTYVIPVYIEGADQDELTLNEADLRRALQAKGALLTVFAGDDSAPPSVYPIRSAQMTPERSDEHEAHLLRKFVLTLTCSPFARSETITTVPAISTDGPPVDRMLDECNSTTGWTGSYLATGGWSSPAAASSYSSGSAVAYTPGATTTDGRGVEVRLTRTGTLNLTDTPYLFLVLSSVNSIPDSFTAYLDGQALKILRQVALGAGQYQLVCHVPAGMTSATTLTVQRTSWYSFTSSPVGLAVHTVSATNRPIVTSREQTRVFEVGGTERTPGSLAVSTSSGFLGLTLVHTMPYDDAAGYSPGMHAWRVSGNTPVAHSDGRKITGYWEPLRPNPVVSRTPSHSLPRGGYVLVAAMRSDTVGTHRIDWSVKSVRSGLTFASVEGSTPWEFTTANGPLTLVPLTAELTLPLVRGNAMDIEVHLLNPSPTVALSVEQWWLFKIDDGCALSVVNTSEANLWLDSPDVGSPVPVPWVGPSRALIYHPGVGLIGHGNHTFVPGRMQVTIVSDATDNASASLTYYKRWHSNAAE